MSKIDEAKQILKALGLPEKQMSDICCFTLLAMAGVEEYTKWKNAQANLMRIHDIITFTKNKYGREYAENSRETFRKQALHHFRTAAIVEDNGLATNSPNYRYKLTNEILHVLKQYNDVGWDNAVKHFIDIHGTLIARYRSKKELLNQPVLINGKGFSFSPGEHNALQKAILEVFARKFAPNSECLYVGDTIKKDLVKEVQKLQILGFEITLHDKMPDVVLYRKDKDWIYFIEAVTSVGPMDYKRLEEIKCMTKNVKSGKIYVTAFLDFATFKKFSTELAWETEVWIADMPDHMIHLNGDKFLGPHKLNQ